MNLEAVITEIVELKATVATLQKEVRSLRRGSPTADDASLETFAEYLHDCFSVTSWTSNQVFEQADDNPLLYAAMVRCLGPDPTIQALSKLLMKRRGQWGEYSIRYVKRANAGSLFTVQRCSTPARIQKSRVGKTTGRRSL